MSREDTFVQLLELIYEAATDPSGWQPFLAALSGAVGGGMTCLTIEHPGQSDRPLAITHGLDPRALQVYSEHFVAVDPFQPIIRNEAEGLINLGEPYIPPRDLSRTEIFNDWYRPNGLATSSIGGTVLKRGDVPSVLGIYQIRGDTEYGDEDLDLARRLMPHVKRALQIHYRLGEAARTSATLLSAMDELAFGVVLVSRDGRVLAANRRARELSAREGSFHLKDGQIRGSRPAETRALERCLHDAVTADSVTAGGTVPIRRPPPKRPLELVVSPLRLPGREPGLPPVAAAIFVNDPDHLASVPESVLRELYGLTPREATIAALLSQGWTPGEIAEQLGITINTVKARMQEVFAKTGTHRQAELVRVLLAHGRRERVAS